MGAAVALTSCVDGSPMVTAGLDDYYRIARMQVLALMPAYGEECEWTVTGPGGERTVWRGPVLYFVEAAEGSYTVELKMVGADGELMAHGMTIDVVHEDVEYSPYITKVDEYCPAPGQFVNRMPLYEEGDTYADMLDKATAAISGTADGLITLGGWGGYVTFSFDHTIVNTRGKNDFRLWGNAFYDNNAKADAPTGSAEPGIVMVSLDTNGNGLPDDEWFELAGSEHGREGTLTGYSIVYSRGSGGGSVWTDSEGKQGTIAVNPFNPGDYYPRWVAESSMEFEGTLLPGNAIDLYGNGTYYTLRPPAWGYADSHPNTEINLNSFDISNAIDSEGRRVELPGIDFIRVYTGVNQTCGSLGETSTEISRAADLLLEP